MPTPNPEPLADWVQIAADHLLQVAEALVLPTLGTGAGSARWIDSTQVHTEHDELAGRALLHRFAHSFPGHALVVEDLPVMPGDGTYEWHIDPIDGSANHLRGIPYVSLSAGLLREGEPVLGVVHDLLRAVTLVGWSGGGAWMQRGAQREPLRLADDRRLSDAMAIVHIARRGPLLGRQGALERLLWRVRKIRCMGSIALDLAMVAAGEADLLVSGRGRPQRLLDILGGLVVLREAGGVLLDANGGTLTWDARTLVAGPAGLCRELVEAMADLDLEGWDASEARPPE